jgi:hypothetical protein
MHVHDPVRLSEHGPVRIDHCGCGAVHLHVGPMTLRLEVASFLALAEAVVHARHQLTVHWRRGGRPLVNQAQGDA